MNTTFNLKRFGLYIKQFMTMNYKAILLFILSMFAVGLFLSFLNLPDDKLGVDKTHTIFKYCNAMYPFLMGGAISFMVFLTTTLLKDYTEKNQSTFALIQPLSNFERLLLILLICIPLFAITYFLMAYSFIFLANYMFEYFTGIDLYLWQYVTKDKFFLGLICAVLIAHTIAFLGGVTFVKNSLLKTIGIIFGIFILLITLGKSTNGEIFTKPFVFYQFYFTSAFDYTWIVIIVLTTVTVYYAAYQKLKEKEA